MFQKLVDLSRPISQLIEHLVDLTVT